MIAGVRREHRAAEGVALAVSRILAPILPRKFRVNPASKIAAALLHSILEPQPGKHWVYSEEMN